MTQPAYVPITGSERVRAVRRLPPAASWTATRPADLVSPQHPFGPGMGIPGPDQGYALSLVKRFANSLILTEGEHSADAQAGAVAIGLRRAALFGRAPVIYDLRLALALWGFIGDPPAELVAHRKRVFAGLAEDYTRRRSVAMAVPEATLRMSPQAVLDRQAEWESLLGQV